MPSTLRLTLLVFAATLALACSTPPAATAFKTSAAEATSMLAKAARHERQALRHDKLRAKALKGAKRFAKQAKKAKGKKRKRLTRLARTRRAKAKKHARKAAWHRKQAARLRALAARLQPQAQPQTRAARRAVRVPLGSAVSWSRFLGDAGLQGTFLNNFDQVTPENELKMIALQPARGVFSFTTADAMVNWALAKGKAVRGHTLIYGSQLPAWVSNGSWTRAELLQVMETHIKTVVAHFRGRIREWDVVNEAIDSGGGYQSNVWRDVIGTDYVDKAFQYAREADPGAWLYYNEGGIDLPDHPRTQGTRSLLAGMKARGVPVDGVGMQNHMTNRFHAGAGDVAETMRRFAALGLKVAVTEMDVAADGGLSLGQEFQNQATIFGGAAQACRQEPACTSFTAWGIGDAVSWLGVGAAPLLFDSGLNPKPAWYTVSDWLRNP